MPPLVAAASNQRTSYPAPSVLRAAPDPIAVSPMSSQYERHEVNSYWFRTEAILSDIYPRIDQVYMCIFILTIGVYAMLLLLALMFITQLFNCIRGLEFADNRSFVHDDYDEESVTRMTNDKNKCSVDTLTYENKRPIIQKVSCTSDSSPDTQTQLLTDRPTLTKFQAQDAVRTISLPTPPTNGAEQQQQPLRTAYTAERQSLRRSIRRSSKAIMAEIQAANQQQLSVGHQPKSSLNSLNNGYSSSPLLRTYTEIINEHDEEGTA